MELVQVKIFNTEIEAELVKTYFEANSMDAFVFGNVLANTYNLFNTTSGGVILKVRQDDLERAQELLENYFGDNVKNNSLQ